MYRTRLGGKLDDVVSTYVSSINDDAAIVRYDILGSIAHVIMLNESRLVSRKEASAILCALLAIKPKSLLASKSAEDIHELVESKVISRTGDAGRRMHTARSRNDQVSLDIRMKLRDDINEISNLSADLIDALLKVASKHTKTVMPLYTHLQHAQYGTLSHYLIAHADSLLRDIERLGSAYGRINHSPLGASAIGGTSLRIDRRRTAKLLGFEKIVENSIDATSGRDHVAEYVAAIAIMMTSLSRIAEDLVIWSTSEFSFIELGDAISSPSSVMPQKKNPDVLELTRGKASETIGNLVSVLATSKGLATGYGRDLQHAKIPAWNASQSAAGALAVMRAVILGIKVNKEQMAQAATSGFLDALEVVEILVADNGVPFRDAHSIVARLVRIAHNAKKRLDELDDGELRSAQSGSHIPKDALRSAIAKSGPQKSLQRRRSTGSAGFAEQSKMLRSRSSALKTVRQTISRKEKIISSSYRTLEQKARAIASKKS